MHLYCLPRVVGRRGPCIDRLHIEAKDSQNSLNVIGNAFPAAEGNVKTIP